MSNFSTPNDGSGFSIGSIRLSGDLILAPMDGYSIHPFRMLTRELGSAASYSEFINARDVINGHPHLEQRLFFTPDEKPFIFQLVDDDPERLLVAAKVLRERNPDAIDINLGCSTPSVSGRGAGAGLLKEPHKIETILTSLCNNLDIPITVKIRLGWDENSKNYLEIAKIVENCGCKAIAVHARTREQGFSGIADWRTITEIKSILSIPVIGNGDIQSVLDIDTMKKETGCDGIMIGRAAIQNPWIFSRLDRDQVSDFEVYATIKKQLKSMQALYGEKTGIILYRKFLVRYLSLLKINRRIRASLLRETDKKVLLDGISNFMKVSPKT
jgi:tRNA-dihydrouridine synthase B